MARPKEIVIKLRRNVKRRLRREMQHTKDAALRVRLNIVLLHAEDRGTGEIAATLGCSTSTVIRVGKRFLAEGEAGLRDRRCENGERKVDDDLLAALVDLLASTPQDQGWVRTTWSTEVLALTLSELTRTQVSASTVRRMLDALGARWGMARPVSPPGWSKRRKNRRIRRLEALVANLPPDEVALYMDEVDIHLNPKIGRDWMLPGQQKEVVTPGTNVKRCLAGGLNPKTGELVWTVGHRRNSDLFLAFLRRVRAAYPQAKRIHIILDNCKAHSSLRVQQALWADFGGTIILHFLPPYSPEHNPIEGLWRQVHANVTRNHRCRTIEALVAQVERFLKHAVPYPGAKPSLARATEAPTTREAAA
jgi:transposase